MAAAAALHASANLPSSKITCARIFSFKDQPTATAPVSADTAKWLAVGAGGVGVPPGLAPTTLSHRPVRSAVSSSSACALWRDHSSTEWARFEAGSNRAWNTFIIRSTVLVVDSAEKM